MDTAVGYSVEIRGFRLTLPVDGLKPHTVQTYVRDAERFLESCSPRSLQDVTTNELRSYAAELGARLSPKTVHEIQLGLRRFFRWLHAEGYTNADPTNGIRLARYRVEPQPTYTPSEVRALLGACSASTRNGIRDRAMVTVLFDTGMRAGELLSMTLPDWERGTAWVDGKSGPRQVPLGDAALQALERYLRRWRIATSPLWHGKRGPMTG